MSKSLEDQARSVSKKLSTLAEKLGIAFQEVATEFLLERMVARLVIDKILATQLVFKGGYVALRAYHSPRFTIDLDAVLKNGDVAAVMKRAKLAIEADLNDVVWFRWEKEIDLQAQGEYGGKRLVFRAGIGPVLKDIRRAQLVNLDIGIGDPIVPGPIKKPLKELLGGGSLSWSIYPIETAASEKLHTLVVRGSENSRAKDVFDLSIFLPQCNPKTLKEALNQTFAHRRDQLPTSIPNVLRHIDLKLIKRGWSGAVEDIEPTPSFEDAFAKIISETERLLD
jgi:hypothetical protein